MLKFDPWWFNTVIYPDFRHSVHGTQSVYYNFLVTSFGPLQSDWLIEPNKPLHLN